MKKYFILFIVFYFSEICVFAQFSNYNIIWNSQSKNSSESMPCGGGDVGLNVWVENNEILLYINKSGTYDETNTLLKSGRIRLQVMPNIFDNASFFEQKLELEKGYITIQAIKNKLTFFCKIWVDVFTSNIQIEMTSNQKIKCNAIYENWRFKDRVTNGKENNQSSWKWAAPKNAIFKKDSIAFEKNQILFLHHNSKQTIFDTTLAHEGLSSYANQMYNPLANLCTGGIVFGEGFVADGYTQGSYINTDYKGWKLTTQSASKKHILKIVLNNTQTESVNLWKKDLLNKKNNNSNKTNTVISKNNIDWWQNYWNKSFIHINKLKNADSAWQVGRNYQLFRYMLGINANSNWPTKFNGGLLTTDPVFVNKDFNYTPDFRNWGGGVHTAQNQRLVYFPMLKTNDWDIVQSQFQFYLRILKNAELRTKVYWNHNGASFTEQMENYGLPNLAEYGTKRPENLEPGLEHNAWLEYEWDTVLEFCLMMLEEYFYTGKNINDKIEFIVSCLRFFDEHYQQLAKKRGIKSLTEGGKLVLYPGSGGETYKMAYNATSTIAALKTVTSKLLQYWELDNSSDTSSKQYITQFQKRIPELNYTNKYAKPTIAPAIHYERINNIEPMQLYPVFPWRMFGVGTSNVDTAINTFLLDSLALQFRSHIGWKQDNIFAANLGLKNEAWHYTFLKLKNGDKRFPAFWGPGFDWLPDHNWGGSGMIGLQDMLLQNRDGKILVLPTWDKEKDVHFKLHAYQNTIVEVEWENGKLKTLNVFPENRKKDVVLKIQ
jgi:hypothetical protein